MNGFEDMEELVYSLEKEKKKGVEKVKELEEELQGWSKGFNVLIIRCLIFDLKMHGKCYVNHYKNSIFCLTVVLLRGAIGNVECRIIQR